MEALNVETIGEEKDKVKMSPAERKKAIQDARDARVRAFFLDPATQQPIQFTVLGPHSLEENQRYTDPTGNKGRHGYLVERADTGQQYIIGPGSLHKGEALGALTIPPKEKKSVAEKAAKEDQDAQADE